MEYRLVQKTSSCHSNSCNRETVTIGLQENDTCRMITDDNQRIYIKAVKTKGGYVKLEIEMPPRYWAERFAYRNEEELRKE